MPSEFAELPGQMSGSLSLKGLNHVPPPGQNPECEQRHSSKVRDQANLGLTGKEKYTQKEHSSEADTLPPRLALAVGRLENLDEKEERQNCSQNPEDGPRRTLFFRR